MERGRLARIRLSKAGETPALQAELSAIEKVSGTFSMNIQQLTSQEGCQVLISSNHTTTHKNNTAQAFDRFKPGVWRKKMVA